MTNIDDIISRCFDYYCRVSNILILQFSSIVKCIWSDLLITERPVFTRGQFWTSGIVIAHVCVSVSVCVCVCVYHSLVHTITHDELFKLESPNLKHRCTTPWLRFPFILAGDRPWPSRSNSTLRANFISFWACPHDNLSPV